MNNSGLGGGFLSGPSGRIPDLESPFHILDPESPLHRHQQTQLTHTLVTGQHHMDIISGLENDHPIGLVDGKRLNAALNFGKGEASAPSNHVNNNGLVEDDGPSYAVGGNCENSDGGKSKKGSTGQRMKWTDNMVGLLVAVVSCVGGAMDGVKRTSGVLQKMGKWITVSKIMISKGCQVSSQQCEDKFNDLNRRYKRLNDILGRGTCCQVVENPALMDSMPNLSAKEKDDVRKILSSKHLFYKEMCAYHNGQILPNSYDIDLQGYSLEHRRDSGDTNGSEDEAGDDNENEDDGMDNEININARGNGGRMEELCDRNKQSEKDGHSWPRSVQMNKFEVEMERVFQDPTKSMWERREWIKMQLLELEEENASHQAQTLEIEKYRFKWLRYCSQKDRELEKLRLENERMKLENEHMILKLKLKQKEHETDCSRSKMSLDPASHGINRPQGKGTYQPGQTAEAPAQKGSVFIV